MGWRVMFRAVDVAQALGGVANGRGFLCRCPCPTHGLRKGDRHPSLSIADGDDQILLHCFAGCDSRDVLDALARCGFRLEQCRKYRQLAGPLRSSPQIAGRHDAEEGPQRSRRALNIWEEARDPRVDLVAAYFTHRGLPPLSANMAGTVFRFHPVCPFGNERVPCLITRFAPIENDDGGEPTAISRTRLDRFNGRDRRMSLGPAAGQVVKLSADADVTLGLGIAESVEKGLALLASGWAPIWATIGTSTMRSFPVFGGVGALTVFCDRDDPGRDAAIACATRWRMADAEVRVLQPPAPAKDWDEWWKAAQ